MKGIIRYAGFGTGKLDEIRRRFEEMLGENIDFECIKDDNLIGGFIANINGKAYDSSLRTRLDRLRGVPGRGERQKYEEDVYTEITQQLNEKSFIQDVYAYGTVMSSGDGIITVEGLRGAKYGEMLTLSTGAVALALDISENSLGAAVLHGDAKVGDQVFSTDRIIEVPVGDAILGRVMNPTGEPMDGGPVPKTNARRPVESPSPSIMDRREVNRPMETGLLTIDSMIPIGKGQRELIIGDRQTGKTTIAIDMILNQRDKDVICIYCAIGQKASTVVEIVETLKVHSAMEYTVVVSSPASDYAAMQYIAPYAACAMAEGFMYAGRDVLIIYDDLSKHAVAYRAMSLLLHRPPGREAYPGDVFYLHSRLLERSAQLSDELGGGSITAIPIIETMANDISAYIPTNVISITDGQIFLESELFHSGMRPAINVGLSVSRVGRAAQAPAMRKVSGALRIELAQYREMAVFLQFGADVDSVTKDMLESGKKKTELLKQLKHKPYSLSRQVCMLLAANDGLLSNISDNEVNGFINDLAEALEIEAPETIAKIDKMGDFDEDTRGRLLYMMRNWTKNYYNKQE